MKFFHLSILMGLLFCRMAFSVNPGIIPAPLQSETGNGSFNLGSNVCIAADSRFLNELEHFRYQLHKQAGVQMQFCQEGKDAGIILKFNAALPFEHYEIQINNERIVISAGSGEGIFYGSMSLLQLINSSSKNSSGFISLPALTIKDGPALEWRGLMLDESRHFFGVEKVKQILDWMAYYKLNRFHWHLTDEPGWRLEILQYPKLGLVGGVGSYTNPNAPAKYYLQSEIREIVAYARQRKIEVIPEIDMPGHATAANRAYPEFSGGGSERNPDFTFHPGKEETYSFLTNILKETDVLFPSRMIHLGGDEVSFGNQMWKEDTHVIDLMKRERLTGLNDVEKYFMRRMADSLYAIGSRILVWDEMADAGLPQDKTIIFWWRHDKPEQLKLGLNNGYKTVICPRIPFYFDFVQHDSHRFGRRWAGDFNTLERVYSFSLGQLALSDIEKSNILGFQANIWTETINNEQRLDYLLFPRIAALAESAWSAGGKKKFDDFLIRLKPHTALYQKEKIYFFNPYLPAEYPEPPLIK
jgi:hexosaminidase